MEQLFFLLKLHTYTTLLQLLDVYEVYIPIKQVPLVLHFPPALGLRRPSKAKVGKNGTEANATAVVQAEKLDENVSTFPMGQLSNEKNRKVGWVI